MKLSPLDIKRQQFSKGFRGYEADEVDAFVQQLASQWESVLEELRLSTERNRELEQKLKHYERVELALQEALETARETARRSEEAAERKAKIIVEQAELKAERTLQDAEQERFGLRRDLAKLTGRQNEVAARLRAFLMSELEILAQFQGDDPVGFIRLEPSASRPEQLEPHTPPSLEAGNEASATSDTPLDPLPTDTAEPTAEVAPTAESGPAPTQAGPSPDDGAQAMDMPGAPATQASAPPPPDPPAPTLEPTTPAAAPPTPVEPTPDPAPDLGWELPATVEPEPQTGAESDWNLRTIVTGESASVAGSEAERDRIRRILEDLD